VRLLLPYHSPEVTNSRRQRTLGGDVAVSLPVAVHVVGVYVVATDGQSFGRGLLHMSTARHSRWRRRRRWQRLAQRSNATARVVVVVVVVANSTEHVRREFAEDNSRVIVRDHIGVAILGPVHVHGRVVPGELLTGLDALVLGAEPGVVVQAEAFDVLGELVAWHGRAGE
jgi:hypothetical protein